MATAEQVSLPSDVCAWNVNHVIRWLQKEGLSDYIEVFQQNDVDGSLLFDITDKVLKDEFRISSWGARQKILRAIKQQYDRSNGRRFFLRSYRGSFRWQEGRINAESEENESSLKSEHGSTPATTPIADPALPSGQHSGWLLKRSKVLNRWKLYWCVVKDQKLLLYQKGQGSEMVLRDEVLLPECAVSAVATKKPRLGAGAAGGLWAFQLRARTMAAAASETDAAARRAGPAVRFVLGSTVSEAERTAWVDALVAGGAEHDDTTPPRSEPAEEREYAGDERADSGSEAAVASRRIELPFATSVPPEGVKAGVLFKLGGVAIRRVWQQRYCVVDHEGTFHYYEMRMVRGGAMGASGMFQYIKKGSFPLAGCIVHLTEPPAIRLFRSGVSDCWGFALQRAGQARVYQLLTDISRDDKTEWIRVFVSCGGVIAASSNTETEVPRDGGEPLEREDTGETVVQLSHVEELTTANAHTAGTKPPSPRLVVRGPPAGVKSGWLWKKRPGIKPVWQKRWFVVEPSGSLAWYAFLKEAPPGTEVVAAVETAEQAASATTTEGNYYEFRGRLPLKDCCVGRVSKSSLNLFARKRRRPCWGFTLTPAEAGAKTYKLITDVSDMDRVSWVATCLHMGSLPWNANGEEDAGEANYVDVENEGGGYRDGMSDEGESEMGMKSDGEVWSESEFVMELA